VAERNQTGTCSEEAKREMTEKRDNDMGTGSCNEESMRMREKANITELT
jgi:hypothetical protein